VAGLGRIAAPEWKRYPDPATELDVIRLTDPAFTSGMPPPHLHQFTRHSETLLYWSERYSSERGTGSRQAFLLDLKQGESRQITDATDLDPLTLSFSPDERTFVYFDGPSLREVPIASLRSREIHAVPEGSVRIGFAIGTDGSVFFAERAAGKSRILSVLRQQARRIAEIDQEIEWLMARPRHAQVLYRADGQIWLVNSDGSGRRQLRTAPGDTGGVLWIPSGRTFTYLHIPNDSKELITLRENSPDEGTDRQLARTSQFISASPNADASVFAGASRSRASEYVLILLRVSRRELTLCEHKASDPAMVQPVFSPDSQRIVFVSDRHGKPALYQVHVNRFVEETGDQ
jgi:Tol biopolymer transport system component